MIRCVSALLFAGVCTTFGQAQEVNLGQAKTLTVEQAQNLKLSGGALRFSKLTELSPEVAAALAKHKIELEFTALESPSVEAIKALAEHSSGLSFPKIAELTPVIAQALAGYQGQRLSLSGFATVSPEAAKGLAEFDGYHLVKNEKQKGVLMLNGVKELSPEAAAALAKCKPDLQLSGLTSLTSIPLAQKLGSQKDLRLTSLPSISDDVAKALFLSPQAAKNTMMYLGLKELSVEAAKALGERGRKLDGHWQFQQLEELPDEVAEALSARAAIRCMKVTRLSDRAAKALNQYYHSHMYALSDVSNESLEMFSKRQGFMIHGLKKLDCVPFAATLMSNNSSFLDLNKLETISEAAADALAMDCRRSKQSVVPLPALKELTSVALAEVLADGPLVDPKAPRGAAQEALRKKGPLTLSKLEAAPDAVVRALTRRTGTLTLGPIALTADTAKAIAERKEDTILGATKLSDEAAKELAKAQGKISLPNLAEISEASLTALRANPKIHLPKN